MSVDQSQWEESYITLDLLPFILLYTSPDFGIPIGVDELVTIKNASYERNIFHSWKASFSWTDDFKIN